MKTLEKELFDEFKRVVGCDPWICGPGTRDRLRGILRSAYTLGQIALNQLGASTKETVFCCADCYSTQPPALLIDGLCVDCWNRRTHESLMNETTSGGPI